MTSYNPPKCQFSRLFLSLMTLAVLRGAGEVLDSMSPQLGSAQNSETGPEPTAKHEGLMELLLLQQLLTVVSKCIFTQHDRAQERATRKQGGVGNT